MRYSSTVLWVLLSKIISGSITQGNVVCTKFGNDLAMRSTSNFRSGLLLMTNTAAGCAGNATLWNACYYSTGTDVLSTVTFGVYHPYATNNYTLIQGSVMSYNVSKNGSAYTCIQFPITLTQQFTIQQGDVIAACIQATGSGSSLNIFGSGGQSNRVWQATANCNSTLQGVITSTMGLSRTIMHVSLDVNECAVNNGGCAQVCNDIALGNNCSCFPGYRLDINNTDCIDIDECVLGAHNCSQMCNNTIGSYVCSCQLGYYIASDSITCLVAGKQGGKSSSTSYSAFVVVLLIPLGIIIFVVGFIHMKRRRKYNLERIGLENMTYNSATGVSKKSLQGVPAYEELDLVEQHPKEIKVVESYEVPKGDTDHYEIPKGETDHYEVPKGETDHYAVVSDETTFSGGQVESEVVTYCSPADCEDALYEQLKTHKIMRIPPTEIESLNELGHGKFGEVHRGVWRRSSTIIDVALKTLNPSSSSNDAKIKLLQEAAVMAQFKHPNVIKLYGIIIIGQNLTLVIELALKGDLRSHLAALIPTLSASDVPQTLLRYSQQVALGMLYLSNKSFVHRDLAARNILVSKDDVCKIADFGLSRDLSDANYYVSHGGMVPVKWTAPEAVLYKKYSSQSDVWSYGCLLYEIWSLGHKPFESFSNTDVIAKVEAGYRLPPPPGCPQMVYEIMIQCWNPDAHARPLFRDLHLSFAQYEDHVLMVPSEALETHPQAGALGASLEAGLKMYTDLQFRYT